MIFDLSTNIQSKFRAKLFDVLFSDLLIDDSCEPATVSRFTPNLRAIAKTVS
ncbi:MAG: hypothetical protein LBL04_01035 [Bacteroidales bacterium]|jgi:hypothetical protein|nr:hypothetical protein [Bacteroidales bacterium]